MKIVSKEEIQDRISEKFPNQPFEIIEYSRVSKPFKIKCLKCQQISSFSSFNNYINSNRKGLCACYNENNKITKHNKNNQLVIDMINDDDNITFSRFWYKEETQKYMVEVKCLKCNQLYSKTLTEFLQNKNCPYCIGKEILNTEAFKSLIPEEYEILSEYKTRIEKVKVRHKKCGFIWESPAKKLYNYIGCPHCNKKRSKGEQKIETYLMKNNYKFEIEKSFDWQSNKKRRYDFYVKDFNLLIEYMGEQHYLKNSYFKVPVEWQQEVDREKEEEAKSQGFNYLIIPYYNYDKIDTILDDWFNDYSARK